jgi:DnaJ-class molecular chaperone
MNPSPEPRKEDSHSVVTVINGEIQGPHTCEVCEGVGSIPEWTIDFAIWKLNSTKRTRCHNCLGEGVIYTYNVEVLTDDER